MEENLDTMKYSELRQMAKSFGIKRRGKIGTLLKAVKKHLDQEAAKMSEQKVKAEKSADDVGNTDTRDVDDLAGIVPLQFCSDDVPSQNSHKADSDTLERCRKNDVNNAGESQGTTHEPAAEHTHISVDPGIAGNKQESTSQRRNKTETKRRVNSKIPRLDLDMKSSQKETKAKQWDKIHQQQFDQFDSIDDYLKKKRKRMLRLCTPKARKNAEMCQTPQSLVKSNPLSRKSSFEKKYPLIRSAIPGITAENPRRQLSGADTNKKSSVMRSASKQLCTPFTPMSDRTRAALKSEKKFDLLASLSQPLTWQPHKGKLKPFNSHKSQYMKSGFGKWNAEVQNKERETRRKAVAETRSGKKENILMCRRRIVPKT